MRLRRGTQLVYRMPQRHLTILYETNSGLACIVRARCSRDSRAAGQAGSTQRQQEQKDRMERLQAFWRELPRFRFTLSFTAFFAATPRSFVISNPHPPQDLAMATPEDAFPAIGFRIVARPQRPQVGLDWFGNDQFDGNTT